jgi:plasmid stabilization system protein ParE
MVTMKVIWTELARSQLREACQYHKEVASAKVAASIRAKAYEKTPVGARLQRAATPSKFAF